jgi:hypothetical protein
MIRFSNIRGAMKYATQRNLKVGVSSNRIPMLEIEHPEIMPCVEFLRNPRMLLKEYVESCEKAVRDIWVFITLQFAHAKQEVGEWWKALPKDKRGVPRGPLIINVSNKSIHVIGPLRIRNFREFYLVLSTEVKYVDRRYIDYVIGKGYATLRLSAKVGAADVPRPVAVYEIMEVNTLKFLAGRVQCDRRVGDVFINRILYKLQELGLMVEWC